MGRLFGKKTWFKPVGKKRIANVFNPDRAFIDNAMRKYLANGGTISRIKEISHISQNLTNTYSVEENADQFLLHNVWADSFIPEHSPLI